MTFLKPHKSIDEQIAILKSRGLIISDEDSAKVTLQKVGYYNLINGFKNPFICNNNTSDEKFIENTKLEYLISLYDYDISLKSRILTKILVIEKILKSIISYDFSSIHGELNYLDEKCFNTYNKKNVQKTKDLIKKIKEKIRTALHPQYATNKQYDCIRHYKNNYGDIPVWIVFNILNFNDIRNFYDCLLPKTKRIIANHISQLFGLSIKPNELFNFICILVEVRNACAHCQRLYTYTTKYDIRPNAEAQRILKFVNLPINNLISIVIIFKHFMPRTEFIDFYSKLLISTQDLLDSIPTNYWDSIAKSMNFNLKNIIRLFKIGV